MGLVDDACADTHREKVRERERERERESRAHTDGRTDGHGARESGRKRVGTCVSAELSPAPLNPFGRRRGRANDEIMEEEKEGRVEGRRTTEEGRKEGGGRSCGKTLREEEKHARAFGSLSRSSVCC
jgi:hypothetical protein